MLVFMLAVRSKVCPTSKDGRTVVADQAVTAYVISVMPISNDIKA